MAHTDGREVAMCAAVREAAMWPCRCNVCSCKGRQHGLCSSEAYDNGMCTATIGGSNMCGCEGGSNVAVQLQGGWRCGLYSYKRGNVACAAMGCAAIWPIQVGEG
jgi:hypothetical protein